MILTLKKNNESLLFAIAGDITSSYTVNLSFDLGREASRTHPAVIKWEGSQMDDLPIKLLLAVGALDKEAAVIAINTPIKLLSIVEKLHNWALPSRTGAPFIESVYISIGNGESNWYNRRGMISSIKCTFKPPWDIATGLPMVAEVDLNFKLVLLDSTIAGQGKVLTEERFRPHVPWLFDRMWS